MKLDDWIKYFHSDMDAVNAVDCLQRSTPYSDKQIIDAIEKIEIVAAQCGLTRMDIIKTIFVNETMALK